MGGVRGVGSHSPALSWRHAPVPGVCLACGSGGHCLFHPGAQMDL